MPENKTLSIVKANEMALQWVTVEQLVQLNPLENSGVLLCVAGRVTQASVWNCYCYGCLESENGESIKFRVSQHEKPDIDELVTIVGSLRSSKNCHQELHGRIEGRWIGAEKRIFIPEHHKPQLLLNDFIKQAGLNSLGFLVSQTAWNDIYTSSGIEEINDCSRIVTSFSNEEQLINDCKCLLSQGVQAVVIARGGGASLGKIGNSRLVISFFVEKSVRFYTAMGHAQDLLLIEKHADEVFRTPSDFGHRLSKIIGIREEELAIRTGLMHLKQQVNKDAIALKEQEIALQESSKKIASLKYFSLFVVLICIFLILTIIFD